MRGGILGGLSVCAACGGGGDGGRHNIEAQELVFLTWMGAGKRAALTGRCSATWSRRRR